MNTYILLFLSLIILVFPWLAQPASGHVRGSNLGGDIEMKWIYDIAIPGSMVIIETGAITLRLDSEHKQLHQQKEMCREPHQRAERDIERQKLNLCTPCWEASSQLET